MCDVHEQRSNVKFCVKLGKTFTQTFQLLKQAHGDDSMGRSQCCLWYNRFKKGRESIEDDPRPGRPVTLSFYSYIQIIKDLARANPCLTIRELADIGGTSVGSCHNILTDKLKTYRNANKVCTSESTSNIQAKENTDFGSHIKEENEHEDPRVDLENLTQESINIKEESDDNCSYQPIQFVNCGGFGEDEQNGSPTSSDNIAKDFECTMCSKKFTTRYNLNHHMKTIHGGSKNLTCPVCSKNFAQNSYLKRHMKYHLSTI